MLRHTITVALVIVLASCGVVTEPAPSDQLGECRGVLPTSRNTTYTPTTPVRSNDINDLQDCVIGMKTPMHWRWQGFHRAGRETNIAFDTTGGLWNGCIRASGAGAIYDGGLVHSLPVGWLVQGFKARIVGTGAAQDVVLKLWLSNEAGMTPIGTITAHDPAAVDTIYTSDPITTPTELAEGDQLIVSAQMPLAGTHVYAFALKAGKL